MMNRHNNMRNTFLGLILIYGSVLGLFGQSAGDANANPLIHLQGINLIDYVYQMSEVQTAERALSLAQLEVQRIRTNLNPSIGINPSVRYSNDLVTLNASLSGSINLGLSADVQSRLATAQQNLVIQELQMEKTLNDALGKLSRTYFTTFLAVQELDVLEREVGLAQQRLDLDQGRFQRGEISFLDVSRSEQDFQSKVSSFQDAQRKAEIAMEDLMILVPMDSLRTSILEARLPIQKPVFDPQTIIPKVLEEQPEVQKQLVQVQGARDRLVATSTSPLSLSLRTGVDVANHSFGISYNLTSTSLGLSYGMPSVQLGNQPTTTSGGGSTSSTPSTLWTLTASASIGIQPDLTSGIQRESAMLTIEREEQRLETLIQTTTLALQRSWIDLERAQQFVTQQEESLARARFLYSVVETRRNLGILGDLDVQEAQLAIDRAEFNLLRAITLVQQAEYTYLNLAGFLVTGLEQGE